MDWKEFQTLVASVQQDLMPGFKASEGVYEEDRAGIRRQLDGVLSNEEGTYPLRVLVEATLSPVDIEDMDAKIQKASRLRINKLVVVTATEFTAPAIKAAKDAGADTWILRAPRDEDWEGGIWKLGLTIKAQIPEIVDVVLLPENHGPTQVSLQLSKANRDAWTLFDASGNPKTNLWDEIEKGEQTEGAHDLKLEPGDHLYIVGKRIPIKKFSFRTDVHVIESKSTFDLAKNVIGVYVDAQNPPNMRFIRRPPGFKGSL